MNEREEFIAAIQEYADQMSAAFMNMAIAFFDDLTEHRQRIAELEQECGRLAALVSIHFPDATMPPDSDKY